MSHTPEQIRKANQQIVDLMKIAREALDNAKEVSEKYEIPFDGLGYEYDWVSDERVSKWAEPWSSSSGWSSSSC